MPSLKEWTHYAKEVTSAVRKHPAINRLSVAPEDDNEGPQFESGTALLLFDDPWAKAPWYLKKTSQHSKSPAASPKTKQSGNDWSSGASKASTLGWTDDARSFLLSRWWCCEYVNNVRKQRDLLDSRNCGLIDEICELEGEHGEVMEQLHAFPDSLMSDRYEAHAKALGIMEELDKVRNERQDILRTKQKLGEASPPSLGCLSGYECVGYQDCWEVIGIKI